MVSKPNRGSVRFQPVSIVLNNDNCSGPAVNHWLGFEVALKQVLAVYCQFESLLVLCHGAFAPPSGNA